MRIAVTAATALLPGQVLELPVLVIEDGRVVEVFSREFGEVPGNAREEAYREALLVPAFLDVHIHGSAGHDVMRDDRAGEAAMGSFLAQHGTSEFLATTVTAPVDDTLAALERIALWIDRDAEAAQARPIGIHLEGPFVSHRRRGVHPPECLQPPSTELFDRFQQAAGGHIKLMTLAPELDGARELQLHAMKSGVRISLGHSDATLAQANDAIADGAVSATHTFNAMRPMEHREPGLTGAVLIADELYAELIADGYHVAGPVMGVWARAKPKHRRILVTDAISATGQRDGEYMLGGIPVTVANGRAEHDGKLAGSVLTLDAAVVNFARAARLPEAEAAVAAALNPRDMLGLPDPLTPGAPADFCLLRGPGVLAAYLGGVRI